MNCMAAFDWPTITDVGELRRIPGMSDHGVQLTANDALLSKLSAVKKGYYKDNFVQYFVGKKGRLPSAQPLMNRGYYARVAAIDKIVEQFMSSGAPDAPKQIVCLGGGLDSRFWRMAEENRQPTLWCDVDFPEVTRKKIGLVQRTPQLLSPLGLETKSPELEACISDNGCRMVTPQMCILPGDLRCAEDVANKLAAAGIDTNTPTLFLVECVLVYMTAAESTGLLRWCASAFPHAALALYEQIRPDTPFGRTMVQNLEMRGCPLRSISEFPDEAAQVARFLSHGFSRAACAPMGRVYSHFLPREDVKRVERLEMFDELEEWNLIQNHYCILLAINETHGGNGNDNGNGNGNGSGEIGEGEGEGEGGGEGGKRRGGGGSALFAGVGEGLVEEAW